jgi:glycosyltransferase involved in cell wall biosynthesis
VVVPVRNEQQTLRRTLNALCSQQDSSSTFLPFDEYEVIVLLNNCTDASLAVARQFQREHPPFRLHLVERKLAPHIAHVGTARGMLMDEAAKRFLQAGKPLGVIASTDGDSVVAPDWICQTLQAIDNGCDAVGGSITLAQCEREKLTPGTRAAYLYDRGYQRLVAHLEALLDPVPHDPWPRHNQHFGASLACTVASYLRAGQMPRVPQLEDVAFVEALERVDARVRHSPQVRVTTSARLRGRVEVGLSWQLRVWQDHSKKHTLPQVPSCAFLEHTLRLRAKLRTLRHDCRGGISRYRHELESIAASVHLAPGELKRSLEDQPYWGSFLQQIRFSQNQALHFPRSLQKQALPDAVAALRIRINWLARNAPADPAGSDPVGNQTYASIPSGLANTHGRHPPFADNPLHAESNEPGEGAHLVAGVPQ